MVLSLHVAKLQGGRGCTEREEKGGEREVKEAEEEEENHQHLESGYSSTESNSPHIWSQEKKKVEKEAGEIHKQMCWDYLLSQVMEACFHSMTIHNSIYHTADPT